MSVTRQVVNGQARYTHTFVGVREKIDYAYLCAARQVWELGYGNHGTPENPIAWDNLTNAPVANAGHWYVWKTLVHLARERLVEVGKTDGAAAGLADFAANVEITED